MYVGEEVAEQLQPQLDHDRALEEWGWASVAALLPSWPRLT